MKPVLIYSMPRTRSTAAMQACKRTVKLNEPFAFHNTPAYNEKDLESLSRMRNLIDYEHSDQWNLALDEMKRSDAVVKIFGADLAQYYHARAWFDETGSSYEIFTLVRDPRLVILSNLLAQNFGFWTGAETRVKELTINSSQFNYIEFIFSSFLRFYPKSSRLVTFETLPEEFFDKSLIWHKNQHSMRRLHLIKNLDEVEKNINTILRYFKKEWKDVTGLDIHTLLPY